MATQSSRFFSALSRVNGGNTPAQANDSRSQVHGPHHHGFVADESSSRSILQLAAPSATSISPPNFQSESEEGESWNGSPTHGGRQYLGSASSGPGGSQQQGNWFDAEPQTIRRQEQPFEKNTLAASTNRPLVSLPGSLSRLHQYSPPNFDQVTDNDDSTTTDSAIASPTNQQTQGSSSSPQPAAHPQETGEWLASVGDSAGGTGSDSFYGSDPRMKTRVGEPQATTRYSSAGSGIESTDIMGVPPPPPNWGDEDSATMGSRENSLGLEGVKDYQPNVTGSVAIIESSSPKVGGSTVSGVAPRLMEETVIGEDDFLSPVHDNEGGRTSASVPKMKKPTNFFDDDDDDEQGRNYWKRGVAAPPSENFSFNTSSSLGGKRVLSSSGLTGVGDIVLADEEPTQLSIAFITSAHLKRRPCYIFATTAAPTEEGNTLNTLFGGFFLFALVDLDANNFQNPKGLCDEVTPLTNADLGLRSDSPLGRAVDTSSSSSSSSSEEDDTPYLDEDSVGGGSEEEDRRSQIINMRPPSSPLSRSGRTAAEPPSLSGSTNGPKQGRRDTSDKLSQRQVKHRKRKTSNPGEKLEVAPKPSATGHFGFPLCKANVLKFRTMADANTVSELISQSQTASYLNKLWRSNDPSLVCRILPAMVHHLPLLKVQQCYSIQKPNTTNSSPRSKTHVLDSPSRSLKGAKGGAIDAHYRIAVATALASFDALSNSTTIDYQRAYEPGTARMEVELDSQCYEVERDLELFGVRTEMQREAEAAQISTAAARMGRESGRGKSAASNNVRRVAASPGRPHQSHRLPMRSGSSSY